MRGRDMRKRCSSREIFDFRSLGLVLVVVLLVVVWHTPVSGQSSPTLSPPSSGITCPLNFSVLDLFPSVADNVKQSNAELDTRCLAAQGGLAMVLSVYIRETGFFLPPEGSSDPCYEEYQAQLVKQGVASTFDLRNECPLRQFQLDREYDFCQGVRNVSDWNRVVPAADIAGVNSSCAGSLENLALCGLCGTAQARMAASVQGLSVTNRTEGCVNFTRTYIAGWVNIPGPLDPGTALCLLYVNSVEGGRASSTVVYIVVGVAVVVLLSLIGVGIMYWRHRRIQEAKKIARAKRTTDLKDSTKPNSSVNWFSLDELKGATRNFSRENLLGTGGYGNVYKGVLPDGEVVAVKRFKNCSPAGDKDFLHEVEIISSVRHKHLVAIRGCCVDEGGVVDGHQRLIVFDYMPNGTLQDHLFPKNRKEVLSWTLRTKIAIGTAKGLAYLHYDALPSIIHRDVKPSNILLDTDFNARLADFGLAKYSPEGVSHLTTKVAGTHGYVAPEYVLYGQLTDKSDVYSFGMVLLELVTGKRVLLPAADDDPPILLSDHVWPLVKQGQWKSVIDPSMTDVGPDDVMERFILTALLCAHPQVHYRPTIDQALKMMESDVAVPDIPDRPLPWTSNMAEIEAHLVSEHSSTSSTNFRSVAPPPASARSPIEPLPETDEPSSTNIPPDNPPLQQVSVSNPQ